MAALPGSGFSGAPRADAGVAVSVAQLDALSEARATVLLTACCGASRWVSAMVARRPFGESDALLAAADEIWRSLPAKDWLEAFAHHPRIGEQQSAVAQTETGRTWSAGEQAGINSAGESLRKELAIVNREYEQRFGYIYVVSAAGRTAKQLLEVARRRLANEAEIELATAAEEQRKITRKRLDKLLGLAERGRDGE
jgi:OHCU decarboxylase